MFSSGLKSKNIPIEARIVTVADIFDALSSDRPYRPGFSRGMTFDILTSMTEVELDPVLVDLFVSICGER